jgi:hypothetical protein
MQRTSLLCTDQSTSSADIPKSVRVASRKRTGRVSTLPQRFFVTTVLFREATRTDFGMSADEVDCRGSLFEFGILAAHVRLLHQYKPYRGVV